MNIQYSNLVPAKTTGNVTELDVTGLGVKSLDEVQLKTKTTLETVVLNVIGDRAYCTTKAKYSVNCTINVHKVSIGSAWRRLCALIKYEMEGKALRDTIAGAIGFDGLPGTGKTTHITKEIVENDMVYCQTRGAVDNLIAKGVAGRQVNTIERGNILDLQVTGTTYIDEATMCDYLDVLPILHNSRGALVILGDTNQIGNIDTSDLPGIRYVTNLLSRVPPANTTKLTKTYRFG